jgi:hypothetical protein
MRTSVLALVALCALSAPARSRAEILATISFDGQTSPHPAQELYVSLAIYNDVFQTPPIEIFSNFKATKQSVGETFVADESNTGSFADFAARLTNGIDGVFCAVITPISRAFEETQCEFESTISSGSSDFEGYEIQSVELTVDALEFTPIVEPEDNFEATHAVTVTIEGTRKVATGSGRWSTLKQLYD